MSRLHAAAAAAAGTCAALGQLALAEGQHAQPLQHPPLDGLRPAPNQTAPYWLSGKNTYARDTLGPAGLPKHVDVVIIGAGLSGAGCARKLGQLGNRSALLLDSRGLSGGASGRNGGFLGGPTWHTTLVSLFKLVEPTRVLQQFQLAESTRTMMRSMIADQQLPCDLDKAVDGFSTFSSVAEMRKQIGWWWYVLALSNLLRPLSLLGGFQSGQERGRQRINSRARALGT